MLLKRIKETAELFPEKTALQMREGDHYRKYSYKDLVRIIASVAGAFAARGIKKGDRVAIFSENRPEYVFAYLATISLKAVVVPLDSQLTEKEVSVLLRNAEAKVVCVSASTRARLPQDSGHQVISFDVDSGLFFGEMMKAGLAAPSPAAPAASDLAAILYTSGTTGDPKGVMLTQGNLASNCDSVMKLNIVWSSDNMLMILPLHHTYAAMICMLLPLSLGATVTMLNSLKGPDILRCMQETKITIMAGVPQLYTAMRRSIFDEIGKKPALVRLLVRLFLSASILLRKKAGVNIGKILFGKVHTKFGPSFRLFASGGARLEPDVHRDMTSLGFTIVEGYGLTETSPLSCFNPIERPKAGSIGIPIPGVEVRIADSDEKGMGEIAVRGPNVMAGYYMKPKETAAVLKDGWFHTGDLGYKDADGYFFITGRSKELIVLASGKNIFPEELEKYYKQIPSIKELCLVQTDRGLEAAVVPDFDYLRKMNLSNSRETISAEIEDLARDLSPYKRIMGLKIFKEALPATRLGKLKRATVRELYLAGVEPQAPQQTMSDEDRDLLASEEGRKLLACLAPFTSKKPIAAEDNLELDLGLDSLSRVELVVSIEKTFGLVLPESFGSEIFTVRDAVLKIQDLIEKGGDGAGERVTLSWAEILQQEPSDEIKGSVQFKGGLINNVGRYLIRTLFKLIFLVFGGMRVEGVQNLPRKGPYIIAPNHLSLADAPLLMSAIPWRIGSQVYFLGITKFFGGPVTSWIARQTQVIPVDMETKLYSALQLSAHVLRRNRVLCAFPEGTRSRDGSLKEFKKGVGMIAKELDVPVVPVALQGTYEMMPTGTLLPKPGKVSVIIGKPLYPGGMDYDEIAKRLREEVVKLMEG